jgi:hypothetical protein
LETVTAFTTESTRAATDDHSNLVAALPLLQPPDARSADRWSSPSAATDAWLNGPITSSVRTTDAARSLRHKRDHPASDRGVIAIDGQHSRREQQAE